METKMRVLKNERRTTTIVSIPASAATGILKSLHENKLQCNYMGLDQSGRILMEVGFDENHKGLMKELNEYIEKCEEIAQEWTKLINELVEKQRAEMNKPFEDIQKKSREGKYFGSRNKIN